MSSATSSVRAEGRSILLMTGMMLRSASNAWYRLARVWASMPCVASTTSTAPSQAFSARLTSYAKSTCPGVSIRFSSYALPSAAV